MENKKFIIEEQENGKYTFIRTGGSFGPRGEYYSWVKIFPNGLIEFGNEQGNYAGGTSCSPDFFGHIAPTYWQAVLKYVVLYKKQFPELWEKVVEVLINYGVIEDFTKNIEEAATAAPIPYLNYKGQQYPKQAGFVKICRPALYDILHYLKRQTAFEKLLPDKVFKGKDLQAVLVYLNSLPAEKDN